MWCWGRLNEILNESATFYLIQNDTRTNGIFKGILAMTGKSNMNKNRHIEIIICHKQSVWFNC